MGQIEQWIETSLLKFKQLTEDIDSEIISAANESSENIRTGIIVLRPSVLASYIVQSLITEKELEPEDQFAPNVAAILSLNHWNELCYNERGGDN